MALIDSWCCLWRLNPWKTTNSCQCLLYWHLTRDMTPAGGLSSPGFLWPSTAMDRSTVVRWKRHCVCTAFWATFHTSVCVVYFYNSKMYKCRKVIIKVCTSTCMGGRGSHWISRSKVKVEGSICGFLLKEGLILVSSIRSPSDFVQLLVWGRAWT